MGTSTKGVVVTSCKNAFFVIDRIESALNALIRPGWRAEKFGGIKPEDRKFQLCTPVMSASSQTVYVHFTYNGDARKMQVCFGCDSDNSNLGPNSISISLGAHGDSEQLVKLALESLAMLGPVYYDASDCDDIPMAPLDVVAPNYLTACANGGVFGSKFTLSEWVDMFENGQMRKGTAEEVIGLSLEQIDKILASSYEDSRDELKALYTPFKVVVGQF